jgi:predicted enzyme related to lactoylglutathione lyase
MKLAQTILFVENMARMKTFYGSVLGLPVLEDGAEWARFAGGGCVLALHSLPPVTTNFVERNDSYIKLCFHSDDVAKTRADLVGRGVKMRELHQFGAATFCDGVDPEGNIFQITSR